MDGDREIYVMNTDGSGLQQLTVNDELFDSAPVWSPDGGTIAFERADAETTSSTGAVHDSDEIYLMAADGSNVRRLTNTAVHDEGPSFAPDGSRLAFTSERDDPDGDIWTMATDGSDARKVAASPALEESPDWQALAIPAPPPPPPPAQQTSTGTTETSTSDATTAVPPGPVLTDTRPPGATLAGLRPRLTHRQALRTGIRFRLTPDEDVTSEVRLIVDGRPALANRRRSTLQHGQTRTFTIRLTPGGRRLVSRRARLEVLVRITLTDTAGNHRRVERAITIKN
jgi:dipeptidyl aminopeptidase/acylaminoacyl peptidase